MSACSVGKRSMESQCKCDMPETVVVRTAVRVTFAIRRDPSGQFVGQIREYPGMITQGRTRASVRKRLIALLRETSLHHPEDLPLFRGPSPL